MAEEIVKCIKCEKEATYDSPEDFCEDHWLEWWNEYTMEIDLEEAKAIRDILQGDAHLVDRTTLHILTQRIEGFIYNTEEENKEN